jgi:hypothetical protein
MFLRDTHELCNLEQITTRGESISTDKIHIEILLLFDI